MLDPYDRRALLDALRPPEGYRLSCAIGTTYSIDLLAMLCAPLAFTMFEWQGDHDVVERDPLLLLEALKRHAEHMGIFCQADRIQVPQQKSPLFACLEESLYTVSAPGDKLSFHPKLWLLRFERGVDVCFRLLCGTRNLTYDRSWDLLLCLDGTPGKTARPENEALVRFFAGLPKLSDKPLKETFAKGLSRSLEELPRVVFEPPDGFDAIRFWSFGKGLPAPWPFPEKNQRALIIAPFIDASILEKITASGSRHVLISREESLDPLNRNTLKRFERIYTLHSAAEPEHEDVETSAEELRGLHAKAYFLEDGNDVRMWVGSANATNAAFHGSFEFLVELRGKKNRLGINSILEPAKGRTGLFEMLQEYDPGSILVKTDPINESLQKLVEEVRISLAKIPMKALARSEGDVFNLHLVRCQQEPVEPFPKGVTVKVWPITLASVPFARTIDWTREREVDFGKVSFDALTMFYAFRIEAKVGNKSEAVSFVLSLPLEGAPEDRYDRILSNLLEDKGKVMRWLLLLLMDADPGSSEPTAGPGPEPGPQTETSIFSGKQLFEMLLRALDRDPERIRHVARLVADLKKSEKTSALLPDGFEKIWIPIQAVYEEVRK